MNIQISDFAKICRLCLTTDKQMKCLFPDSTDEVNEMEKIVKMIGDFIIYPVSKDDDLPDKICLGCLYQIRATYRFKNKCERSFELLASVLETYDTDLDGRGGIEKDENNEIISSKNGNEVVFIETVPNDVALYCTYCAESFHQEADLYRHISVLHQNLKNVCSLCNTHFESPTMLGTHISSCHSGESMTDLIKCEPPADEDESEDVAAEYICNTSELFKLTDPKIERSLSPFDNSGNDSRSYALNDGQPVTNQSGNDAELRTHEPLSKRAYICETCNKTFCNSSTLKRHIRESHSEKKHECDVCNKVFSRAYGLTRHRMRDHDSAFVPSYTCDICNKTFNYSSLLIRHKLTHLPEKPACEVCNKVFSRADCLRRHQLLNHKAPSGRTYKCDTCNKTFRFPQHLNKHKKIHLPGMLKCHICDKVFSRTDGLRNHLMRTHVSPWKRPYKCDKCNKTFKHSSHLCRHKRRTHGHQIPNNSPPESAYKCNTCNKCFCNSSSLKRHEKTHSENAIVHKCSDCDKVFTSAAHLWQHVITHCAQQPENREIDTHLPISCSTHLPISCSEKQLGVISEQSRKTHEGTVNVDEYLQIDIKEDYNLY